MPKLLRTLLSVMFLALAAVAGSDLWASLAAGVSNGWRIGCVAMFVSLLFLGLRPWFRARS